MKKRVISILLGVIATLTLGVSFPKEAHADWKKDNIGWYYQDNDSYYTGWKLIDNNWYYFYSDGYMATNDKIGDYFVNSTGAWTNEITADEARELIYNEDGNFLTKEMTPTNYGYFYGFSKLGYCYEKDSIDFEAWNIPDEPAYVFTLTSYTREMDGSICGGAPFCIYIVGKESKNVYVIPGQGGMNAYQIQDNKKIKTYRCLGFKFDEWR